MSYWAWSTTLLDTSPPEPSLGTPKLSNACYLPLLHRLSKQFRCLVRWPRELIALQLQKTHANRKITSKSRKHFHHFDSRWYKCSKHKQIKKHAANAHNTTKYILFAVRFFFGCVVSICRVCVVKLTKVFS